MYGTLYFQNLAFFCTLVLCLVKGTSGQERVSCNDYTNNVMDGVDLLLL